MIVEVVEDGYAWARLESKQVWIAEGNDPATWPSQGKVAILKIPGVPLIKGLALRDAQMVDDAGVATTAPFRRRAWQFKIDLVPQAVRDEVLLTGEYTTTVAAIRNFLRRIRDDAQYTGLD